MREYTIDSMGLAVTESKYLINGVPFDSGVMFWDAKNPKYRKSFDNDYERRSHMANSKRKSKVIPSNNTKKINVPKWSIAVGM